MFCTLQLVWQAPLPPESATGMGNLGSHKGRYSSLAKVQDQLLLFSLKTYSNDHFLAVDFPISCVLG